jgi:isocitrate/isopropylmalate dehydrogenase
MLDHIGQPAKATALRQAIVATLEAKDSLTPDLGGNTMSAITMVVRLRAGGVSARCIFAKAPIASPL